MEPTGLAVGVLGLAGLFNNAVDCFKYIQLGRNFGIDFQTCLLKLDIAQLRLSRWGYSIGLSGDAQNARSLEDTLGSQKDVSKAEEILGHIIELFARVEQAAPNTPSLTYDPQADLTPVMGSLHKKMQELSHRRQNQTGLRQKTKWALYKGEHVRKLIEEVSGLVQDLVELFPGPHAIQQQICQDEVHEISQITSIDSLDILRNLAANQDKDLRAAITKTHVSHLKCSNK